jgi:hypothetical protein
MATIRLGRYEVEEYPMPPVCAKCGARAVVAPDKRFAWSPPWLAVLILLGALGLLLYIILALSLTRRMTVPLPLCERHRDYWRNRRLFIWGGLAVVVLFGIAAIALGIVLDDRGITDSAILVTILSTVGLFVAWLISAAVVQNVSIRCNEITDRAITVTGLSDEFVDAVREARRGEEREEDEEDDRPRRRRRRADDEEDDRPRARRREKANDGGYYDRDEQKPRPAPPPDAIEEGDERR